MFTPWAVKWSYGVMAKTKVKRVTGISDEPKITICAEGYPYP